MKVRQAKTMRLLLLVGSALFIVGAGLSAFGSYQSEQLVPVIRTSTSTRSFATSSELAKISNYQFEVNGTAGTNYSCYSVYVPITYSNGEAITFDAGRIHVTFSTQSSKFPVDFWLLSQPQFPAWLNAKYCSDREQIPSVLFERSVSSFDRVLMIPEKGSYYFAFANFNEEKTSVTITANQLTQISGVDYVTQTTSIPEPAGSGGLFYSGVGAVIAGAVVLAVSRIIPSGGRAHEPLKDRGQTTGSDETVTQSGFCAKCGAKLVSKARFCKECGSPAQV